jgi:cytidylate kinase
MARRLPTSQELHDSGLHLPPDAVVAIDGPAGSGKSTTARAIARDHRLTYIDTGAMYRALTLAALEAGVATSEGSDLADLLGTSDLTLRPNDDETVVIWNGRDVSRAVRTPIVDAAVSAVSAHPEVRRRMVERQRELGRRGGVVMEGRDIGSVVFPLATAKLFLDATLEARAARRHRQFEEQGAQVPLTQVQADLAERDRQDTTRADSPLTIAPDALVLDTSSWTLEQQLREASLACLVNVWLDREESVGTDREESWRAMSFRYRLAYALMIAAAWLCRRRLIGMADDRVPPAGVVLASNHVTQWDPPIVGSTLRRAPMPTMAKAELFRVPGLGALLRWVDTIPVRRAAFDKDAFAAAKAALENGAPILLFPEGTRRPLGRPGPIKAGLGLLLVETGVDFIPIFVRGTGSMRIGGHPLVPLEVRYGPRVRLHALPVLLARQDRREVIRGIGALFLGDVLELQARSFADTPLTRPELELQEKQGRRDRGRQRPFGAKRRP